MKTQQMHTQQYNGTLYFSEKQYFRQWWVMVLMGGLSLLLIYGWVSQVLYGHQFGTKPMDDTGLTFLAFFMLVFNIAFFNFRLVSSVTAEGIHIQFFPFHRKGRFFAKQDITKAYIRKYNSLLEYGGWGIRGLGNNRAYNTSGNMGIQLELTDGKHILIGTLLPQEAAQALTRLGFPQSVNQN